MKHLSVLIVVGALLFSGCAGQKSGSEANAESTDQKLITAFEPQLLTQQDGYPGVHTSLKKIRTYRAIVRLNAAKAADINAFLTDSVRLPVSRMLINGEEQRMPFPSLKGKDLIVEVEAIRFFYQDHAPQQVEEVPVELSGKSVPSREVWLECIAEGDTIYRSLGTVEILESIRGR